MDDNQRSLWTPLLLGLLLVGTYFLYEQTFGGATQPPAPATNRGGAATAVGSQGLSDARRVARARAQHTFTLRTSELEATLTDRNAALTSLHLLGPKFRDASGRPQNLVTTDREEFLPLALDLRGVRIPADATWHGEQLSPTAVRFTWEGDGFRVVRKVEATGGRYQLWSTVRVVNLGAGRRPVRVVDTLHHYVGRNQEESGGFIGRPSPLLARGVCTSEDDDIRDDRKALEDARGLGPAVHFVGIENTYFAMAVAAENGRADRCVLSAKDWFAAGSSEAIGTVFAGELHHPRKVVEGHRDVLFRSVAYVGPKDMDALTASGHHFSELVDLGFFSAIARGLIDLLRFIQTHVGNWGLAIILLTFLVKLLLYPLTERSFQSMAKMKVLKPEMDRINELYADDREKKGAAIMALYQKHKINPLAGCLPSLLQMPVWFALYQSLSTNIELYHTPFVGFWQDLSAPDPFYVLPLVLGALMWVQQKMTPSTMDPLQAKMMLYMMPAMITVFMLFLPAGLCVYMVTNSTLGIAQQKYIQWRLDRASVASTDTAETAPSAEAPSTSEDPKGDRDKKGTRRGRS